MGSICPNGRNVEFPWDLDIAGDYEAVPFIASRVALFGPQIIEMHGDYRRIFS